MGQFHVFFFPMMAQGHIIPTLDMAKLFVYRGGAKATVITTPLNLPSLTKSIQETNHLGMDISVRAIPFPAAEAGLPEGCERIDQVASEDLIPNFFRATAMLQAPLELLLQEVRPTALVADMFFPWATAAAAKFDIPRLVFHGISYFALCAAEVVRTYMPHRSVPSDSEPFLVPHLPHEIRLTRSQLAPHDRNGSESFMAELHRRIKESEARSFGVVVNSVCELEADYAEYYGKVLGKRAWHIGPLLRCDAKIKERAARKEIAAIAPLTPPSSDCEGPRHDSLKWLDSKKPNSTLFVSLKTLIEDAPSLLDSLETIRAFTMARQCLALPCHRKPSAKTMVQTRSNANAGIRAPHQGENSATGGRHPPITMVETEALIQRVGITAEQFKEKKVRRSQKKKATKPNGKAMMEDELSRLDEEDESSSFERMSAFDCLGDPKSKKPRTSAFERLQDTRLARKGDLRDTLKERRGESTATSKIGSGERRRTVEDKGEAELWRMYEQLEKRLDAQNPYRQAVFSEDHLARFGANVVMYAYPEEIKCRCFLATLEGQACEWFHKLPKGSVDKWSDLAHKFLEHFASNVKIRKIRKGGQLREFVNRCEKEARDVQGADDQALIAMLQAALPQGDVRKELRRNPLSTYQEMLARAKYLALEEEDVEPPVRKEKKSGPPVVEGKKRKDYGKGPNPTGFHANRHHVHAVQSLPALPCSRESYGEGQEDGRRHLGIDCDDLDEEERQGRQHLGCRFIMGGNTRGDSVSSRKKWKNMVYLADVQRPPLPKRKKKEPLIFTDEDYPPVLSPHRDALAIKVEINNVVVHRTLVDTCSSVNVMYSNTFKELGLSRSDLKPIHTPLSGFTGDTIEDEGTITVKAGVGDGTHRLWIDMEFMVVQLDCARFWDDHGWRTWSA
ncbi:unnamed protein product [Cuscuta campestris]|uniref:Retrotransposon gag domain-containing protein n=1 Tax=Cuscuta campestris TaxID=132261 RepID=A0A484L863_9ASTE|nr:unnamed protein product [Cuscuta campestris]